MECSLDRPGSPAELSAPERAQEEEPQDEPPLVSVPQPAPSCAYLLWQDLHGYTNYGYTNYGRSPAPLRLYLPWQEPNTLSYSLISSDSDPLTCTIFERFTDRDTAYKVRARLRVRGRARARLRRHRLQG